jgi:hypothetical protein
MIDYHYYTITHPKILLFDQNIKKSIRSRKSAKFDPEEPIHP